MFAAGKKQQQQQPAEPHARAIAAAGDADDWLSVGASFVPEPSRHRHRRDDAKDNDDTESSALRVYHKSDSKHKSKEAKKHKKKKSKRDDSSSRKAERRSRKRPRAASSSASDSHSSSSSSDSDDEKAQQQQQLVRYKERHLKKQKEAKSKKKKKKKKSSSSTSRRRHSDNSSNNDSGDDGESRRSKGQKRLRDGEVKGSSNCNQAVVASAPKEVQVWMQQTAVIDADTTYGSPKLFEFDCAGDNENRFYGTLYAQDKPLYTLATRRSLFTGKWLVERKPAVQQQQQFTGGDRGARKGEERASNRYFGARARQMERNSRQQRMYLAYSEKRLARQRGGDPGTSTELAYIPLDPVLEHTDSQEGDSEDLLRTETANIEQYLVTRNKIFNETLKQNPRDTDTWLDLVAFQEQALRLTRPSKSNSSSNSSSNNSSSLSAMVVDKQAAILKKAIEANPDNRELQLVKLKLEMRNLSTVNSSNGSNVNSSAAAATRDHEALRTQLEALIEKDPTNGDLWSQLVLMRQQNFASFSVSLLRDMYARIIAILRKELGKVVQDEIEKGKLETSSTTQSSSSSMQIFDSRSLLATFSSSLSSASIDTVIAASEKARELVRLLLDFHSRMCSLEQKAGYTERSIAQFQALIDFNSMGLTNGSSLDNGGQASEHRHAEVLRKFTARWDQNLPHFGDDIHDLATASAFVVENAFFPPSEAFARLVHEHIASQLSAMNPPAAIQSHEHQQSLLRLSGIHRKTKGDSSRMVSGGENSDYCDDDSESPDESALTYSNVHGYRIKLDEIDDTSEYERILSELRGTEVSIAKQQSQSKKEEQRETKSAKLMAKFHDERADFDPIDGNEDAFCHWFRQEQAKEMTQWLPLRSTSPEHQDLIDDAPDRAVLTEEIQPFLFQVPRVMRLKLVFNLLKLAGLRWLNKDDKASHDTTTPSESLYADSHESEYDELVKPILSAMDPVSAESILLTTVQRKDLLQQALLDDVRVDRSALVDASKVAFIRNVFVLFLDLLHSEGDRESVRLVKFFWIAYEAQLVSSGAEGGDDKGLQYARQLCQKLMESADSTTFSHTPSGPSTDVALMFAYAKLELRAGSVRQVNRICDKTLTSLDLHSASDAQIDRSFHALLFLRARSEIWQPKSQQHTDEELRKVKTLYVLWNAWQPQDECESLEKLEKQFRKAPANLKQHLHDVLLKNNGDVKTAVVETYRLELEIATQQRMKQSKCSGDGMFLTQSDWFSTIGYCVYNLCLAIYATVGFQAACSEFQAQLSMLYWDASPSEHHWLRLSYLEFIQQHQLSSSFPIVAPRDWRFAVGEAVERFPHDPLQLRLYVDAETSNTMSQSLRRHFQSVRTRWQRHFDSPLVIEWLFALLCEFSRLERSVITGEAEPGSSLSLGTAPEPRPPRCCFFHKFGSNLTGIERIRRVFQEMVESSRTQGSALCWRLYVRFEVQMGKIDTARRVFYRGLAKCPWSKALYLDGVRVLRPYLSAAECKELVDFMTAKELHVRVEEEDGEDEENEDEISPNGFAKNTTAIQETEGHEFSEDVGSPIRLRFVENSNGGDAKTGCRMNPMTSSTAATAAIAMDFHGGARKRVTERQESYVERLQAVSGCVKTVDDILDEFFPFQANYRLAESLVTPPLRHKKRTDSSAELKRVVSVTLCSPVSCGANTKKKRLVLTTPLQAIERSSARRDYASSPDRACRSNTPTATSYTSPAIKNALIAAVRDQDQHTLALWEDKFRGRRLSPQDVLFLVAHADIARVLESAGLLREAGVTYDQLMELEVALESLRKARFGAASIRKKELQREPPVYEMLRDNVWLDGIAFKEKSVSSLGASRGTMDPSPRKGLLTPLSPAIERVATCSFPPVISSPTSTRNPTKVRQQRLATALPYDRRFVVSRESNTSEGKRHEHRHRLQDEEAQMRSSSSEKRYRQVVRRSCDWVRDHCVQELLDSNASSAAIRKHVAVDKLADVLTRSSLRMTKARFSLWLQQMLWSRCQERVHKFCKLKCALWVMARARTRLKTMIATRYQCWLALVAEQHEMERLAALVTIQSLARVLIAKRVRSGYRVHHAATLVQARWRGFFCRKMLKRTRRYHQYTLASVSIQKCFRAHVFRREFHEFLVANRAARVITRTLRRYCTKRRLTRAWLHRLARFHASIAVQLWFKFRMARTRRARARKKMRESAALVMQHFFKRARFLLLFDRRVHLLIQRKTLAARKLQMAYRAKLARARFHALKDELEAQRRDAVLRVMWENAYATSIQRCWRKRKMRETTSMRVVAFRSEADGGTAKREEETEDGGEDEESDCGYAIDMSTAEYTFECPR